MHSVRAYKMIFAVKMVTVFKNNICSFINNLTS